MKFTATTALLWELFRRTRWILLATLPWMFGICLLLVILYSYRESITDASSFAAILNSPAYGTAGTGMQDMAISAMFIGLIVPMAALLLVFSDEAGLQVALPLRILRLPMTSRRLVAIIMVYGAVSIGLVALATTWAIKSFFDTDITWTGPLVICVCVMAALQTWALALGSADLRVAIGTLTAVIAAGAGLLWLDPVRDALANLHPAVPLAGFLSICYAVGVWGVRFNRHSGFADLANTGRGAGATDAVGDRFETPERAQAWYEWRRYGWHLPLCLMGVLLTYFLVTPLLIGLFTGGNMEVPTYVMADDAEAQANPPDQEDSALFFLNWATDPEIVAWGIVLAVALAALMIGGYRFVATLNEQTRSTFLFARPIETRDLAAVRVRVALRSVLLATGMLIGAFALLALIDSYVYQWWGELNFVTRGPAILPAPALLGLFFLGLGLIMWVAAWPVNVGWFLAIVTVVFVPVFAAVWATDLGAAESAADPVRRAETIARWCEIAVAAVAISALAWAWYKSKQLGLLIRKPLMIAAVMWVLYCAAFFVYQYVEDKYGKPAYGTGHRQFFLSPFDRDTMTIIWGNLIFWLALSLLPLAPIITQPLLMYRARHR